MSQIRFGTSGWRAVIAEDFTVEAVHRVTSAIGEHLKARFSDPEVAVGYDARFMGARTYL